MKKTLVMGAASVALAAMPVLGAFATHTDPAAVVDTLEVTVAEVCTLERTTGGGSYINTMTASDLKTDFGTSTFTAVCNGPSGYSVAAAFTALTGSVRGSIAYSATTPTAGSGTWTAAKGTASSTDNMAATDALLMDTSGPDTAAGTAQQVSYKVSTQDNIAQGSYTGTATYTLSQK